MLSKSRKGIQSDRYIKKRRIKTAAVCALFVVAVGSAITAFSLLSKANFVQITSVRVNGTNLVSAASVQIIVENGISGNWLGVFSKNSIFLYPKDAIEKEIIADFPPVAAVTFSHDGFHTLDVTVTERTPFALACPNAAADSADGCFDMDSNGFVYAPAPQFSPGVFVDYFVTASSTASASSTGGITPGVYIVDPSQFAVARQAVEYFSGLGLTPVSVMLPENDSNGAADTNDDYEVLVNKPASAITAVAAPSIATSSPAVPSPTIAIYFNTAAPLDTTFEYFSAFWQHETDKNFEYIDLRYGKDIVFKMD